MYKLFMFVLFITALSTSSVWGASSGELILKNASHGDQLVGTSPDKAISQGHDLKIVVQSVTKGKKMADGDDISIQIRHGDTVYKQLDLTLNDTGYGELIFTVPYNWNDVYQITATLNAGAKHSWTGTRPFRVITAEPGSDVPEATPLMLLITALLALCLCWRPLVQRDSH